MTRAEFQSEFGSEMRKFMQRTIFKALLDVLQEESPMIASAEQIPGNIVVGGHVLYAEVSGYQKAIKGLKTLGMAPPESKELEHDYKTPAV